MWNRGQRSRLDSELGTVGGGMPYASWNPVSVWLAVAPVSSEGPCPTPSSSP